MPDLTALVALLRLASKDRTQLALENIALRHQLAVYKRSVGRTNITDRDRIFWQTVVRTLTDFLPLRALILSVGGWIHRPPAPVAGRQRAVRSVGEVYPDPTRQPPSRSKSRCGARPQGADGVCGRDRETDRSQRKTLGCAAISVFRASGGHLPALAFNSARRLSTASSMASPRMPLWRIVPV